MSARTLELALDGHGADNLPEGFVIEERLDARQKLARLLKGPGLGGKRLFGLDFQGSVHSSLRRV